MALFHIYSSTQPATSPKLLLLDLDGTLITSKSGAPFGAKGEDDWIFLGPTIPEQLQRFHDEGWTMAIVTNQSNWQVSPAPKAKIESVLAKLTEINGWAPYCLVATATKKQKDTVYRKPGRGLFDKFMELTGSPSFREKMMCGDAVGPLDPYPPYRWSDSDRLFAEAIGARFVRPCDLLAAPLDPLNYIDAHELQIVLMMGNQGSGKSSGARHIVEKTSGNFVHLEQDVVGSKAKMLRAAREALKAGKSPIVDATHGSATNRAPYLLLAAELGVPCKILWFIRDGRPFNALRGGTERVPPDAESAKGFGTSSLRERVPPRSEERERDWCEFPRERVPPVAYAVYTKHFVEPEGAFMIT